MTHIVTNASELGQEEEHPITPVDSPFGVFSVGLIPSALCEVLQGVVMHGPFPFFLVVLALLSKRG